MKPDSANRSAPDSILLARWVLPVSSEPIADGAVILSEDRIVAVTTRSRALEQARGGGSANTIVDFGDAVMLPGLINLHSHVEDSYLRGIETGAPLFEWILNLVKTRSRWSPEQRRQSAEHGARLAALSGTSFMVDCSNSGEAAYALAAAGLRSLVALEIFGLREEATEFQWRRWLDKLESIQTAGDAAVQSALSTQRMTLSVSPHSPYTVSPALWRKCSEWASERQLPVCAHVAESRQECDWVQSRNEVINDYLAAVMPPLNETPFNADLLPWRGKGLSPVQHLKQHNLLNERLLVVHAVHASKQDLETLQNAGASIAHCPRSNAMLRNGRADLAFMMETGIPYGIATDGLASCPDLSLLSEAKFALLLHRSADPQIRFSSRQALEAITIGAARAIGMDTSIGALEPGHKADIAVFVPRHNDWHLHQGADEDPHDLLLFGEPALSRLYVDGAAVVVDGRLAREDISTMQPV